MGSAPSTRHLVYKLLIHLLLLAALIIDAALGQSAQMVGGRPPTTVMHELCDIASVFSQLSAIKTNPDCTAGCAQGSGQCPADWYPGAACVPSARLPALRRRLIVAVHAQGPVQRGVRRDLRGLLCGQTPAPRAPSPHP